LTEIGKYANIVPSNLADEPDKKVGKTCKFVIFRPKKYNEFTVFWGDCKNIFSTFFADL